MSKIQRLGFQKSSNDLLDFEIVDLHDFFKTRSMGHLSRVFRLDFYILMYITSGEGKHEIDFITYDIKEGDVILIAQNQVHRFIECADLTGYILLFTEDFLYSHSEFSIQTFMDQFNTPLNSPVISINVNKEETNRILIDLLYKEYQMEDESYNKQLIKSVFGSFLLTFCGTDNSDEKKEHPLMSKRFVEFRNLVEMHYTEKKTVQEYAEMMLVTQKTINQTTRMVVDLSAKQFIIDRLLLEIKRYLGQGKLTINEISDLMGFDEPSNFTKFFKRYEGVSPTEFKKKYYHN